jgi:Uma2 family endonuclease
MIGETLDVPADAVPASVAKEAAMPVSEETYRRVALEDPEGKWELICGRLREKPIMTTEHNDVQRRLDRRINAQLSEDDYAVSPGNARLRIADGDYYVPDLCVIPRAMVRRLRAEPGTFEVYDDPVPLVVEIWSPSTGRTDLETKLPEYRARGDLEIWLIHPYERTLTAWRRQPDGSYSEALHTGGTIQPVALPGVSIELDRLFD